MEEDRFREYIREALAHLYDHQYLETHPLAGLLGEDHPGEARGQILHRVLLDAIQALKPRPDIPYESLAWRKYRYLYLRYVQALPVPDIASDLGISARQSRRYSLEALAAVTHVIWDRLGATIRLTNIRLSEDHDRALPSLPMAPGAMAPGAHSEAGLRAGEARADSSTTRHPAGATTGAGPAAERLASERSVVDQEMARIEGKGQDAVTPIGELVTSVIATMRPLAERRGRALRALVPDSPIAVAAERTVLRQALLSALSLGLEAGSSGVSLSVDLSESRSGDASSGEALVVLLARFDLVEADTVDVDRLLGDERWRIAYHLLQAHGGQLDLRSSGPSHFTISLALRAAQGLKVLIVEDNPDTIQLYRRYLSNSPYSVLAAADSTGALALAEAEQPSAILLDVMMPSRDGWEVLQLLKSNPETEGIPVVVCSILKERDLALALGAADFLVKPVARPDLLRSLEEHCERRSAGRPGSREGSA